MEFQGPSLMEMMDELASVKMMTFKVATGVFFALTMISVIGRAGIIIQSRRSPTLDDYFVFFGCLCLIAGTGVLYTNFNNMYLTQALYMDPNVVFEVGSSELVAAVTKFTVYLNSSLSLLWTATFSVKFSFLAFFLQLIQSVNHIHRYYWGVVAFTVISWMFVVAEPFILCPHFGIDSIKCSTSFNSKLYFSLTGFVTALDAFTDLMIVSIPILVLRQAKMRTRQKVAVGSFLCLSLVMVAMAITRVSKMHGVIAIDIPYELFWQYLEAAIALLMASLTAYRTFFVIKKEKQRYRERMKRPSYSFRRFRFRKRENDEEMKLPEIPRSTMTGMRTFIRRNNRTAGDTTMMLSYQETMGSTQ